MDDRKLEVLVTVLHQGSFSKAAEVLGCTQSAVTQAMNRVEGEFGFRILERSHNGVRLTEAGERMYPYIISAEASMRQLSEQAGHISEARALPLRIGAFSSIAHTWLPKMLRKYSELHPEMVFDIRVGTSSLEPWMIHGEEDLALGDADRCRAFDFTPLHDDPYYAVMPGTDEYADRECITQQELLEVPFIMAPEDVPDKHMSQIPANRISVSCDDDSTLLAMVEAGIGATIIPKLCLRGNISNVCVLNLEPPAKRVIGVALPKSPTRAAREFAAFLRDEFARGSVF